MRRTASGEPLTVAVLHWIKEGKQQDSRAKGAKRTGGWVLAT